MMLEYTFAQHISNIYSIKNIIISAENANCQSEKFTIVNSIADFTENIQTYLHIKSFSVLVQYLVEIIEYCNSDNYSNKGFNEKFDMLIDDIRYLLKEIKDFYNINVYFKGNDKYNLFNNILNSNVIFKSSEEIINNNKGFNILVISEETCIEELNNNDFDKVINYDSFMNDCFNTVEKIYYNNYDYHYLINSIDKAKDPCTDGIIVGASYALRGIDESILKGKVVQLSLPSQDLYYSFKIAKEIIEENSNIKKCFIGTGYWSFHTDISKSPKDGFPRIQNVYYPLFKDSHNYDYRGSVKLQSLNDFVDIFASYIFNISKINRYFDKLVFMINKSSYFNQNFDRDKSSILQSREFSSLNVDEKYNFGEARANAHNGFLTYADTFDESINIIKEFLGYLCSKNIKAIIVNFPVTDYYYKFFDKEYISLYNNLIKELSKLYKFKFIDLNNLDIFNESDFVDFDHLNYRGALKVSNILKDL